MKCFYQTVSCQGVTSSIVLQVMNVDVVWNDFVKVGVVIHPKDFNRVT